MSNIIVDVLEDRSFGSGGYAIIRLSGLTVCPPDASFRIDPIDDRLDPAAERGWPKGDLKPLETRLTKDGIELVVGPDVVDSVALQPGTPVTISVPAAGVTSDILWPEIAVSRQRRRGAMVMSSEQITAATREAERVKAEAAAKAAAEEARRLAEAQLRTKTVTSPAGTSQGGTPSATTTTTPAAPAPTATTQAAAETAASEPGFRFEKAGDGPTAAARSLGQLMPFAAGALAATIIMSLLWFGTSLVSSSRQAGPQLAREAGVETAVAAAFRDVFAVGDTSPGGKSAKQVDVGTALALADHSLRGGEAADKEEAYFWLRKALALAVGGGQMRWALTQLGSLYAQPNGKHTNHDKARSVWEIAAAQGDPVALCFLGALHEHGLVASPGKGAALSYYEAARKQGGCRGLNEAIARVKE